MVAKAQDKGNTVFGRVIDSDGEPIPYAIIHVVELDLKVLTTLEGEFEFENVPSGTYTLTSYSLGFIKYSQQVDVKSGKVQAIKIKLKHEVHQLEEVVLNTNKYYSKGELTEKTGFSVEVVEMEKLSSQSIDVNSVLDHTAGVRVKRSGGLGSDFVYTLDGMTGNSIRFLVDGIPVEYFGSVYNINNFPISLIDRVEVYKGVVPVYLAADALGGAVNLITINKPKDFLEASYSFGSFNTHRVAVQGQWSDSTSGLTTRLSTFYNYSDNNYKVWGKTVTYYDESTGYRPVEFTKENPATRFNDDYRSACVKADIGFINRKWTDKFFVGLLASDLNRGVQHGQTMAYPFGDMRYTERFYMPNVSYSKDDFLLTGLDIKLFSSYAITNGTTIDTSTNNYNWRGDVVSVDLDGGERRNQRSLFYLWDKALISSINAGYEINEHYKVVANFMYKGVNRTGADDYTAWYTTPFVEPQSLKTSFTGLSLNTSFLKDRLKTDVFLKHYGYEAFITEVSTSNDESGVVDVVNKKSNVGGGIASAIKPVKKVLVKISFENAIRLPDTREALGDGVNVYNSPQIEPERSFNVNIGVTLGKYLVGENHSFKLMVNGFYRNTKDLIYPEIQGGRGEIQFKNIAKILGKGGEFEINYEYKKSIEFTYNVTYLDIRDNLQESFYGVKNVTYRDRLRNAPYFMSNATVSFMQNGLIQKNSASLFYCQAGYVHEYYLGWPSLGDKKTKSVVPTQFVLDLGFSYTLPSKALSIGFDASNLLDTQVYDNFLLQKPGRAFAVKLTYRISKM